MTLSVGEVDERESRRLVLHTMQALHEARSDAAIKNYRPIIRLTVAIAQFKDVTGAIMASAPAEMASVDRASEAFFITVSAPFEEWQKLIGGDTPVIPLKCKVSPV